MNATVDVIVDVVNASGDEDPPSDEDFRRWAVAALERIDSTRPRHEISIRLVGEDESAHLNEKYRGKQGPTNVLSFPFSGYHPGDVGLMGDLAICAPLVSREAAEQDKAVRDHWAHLCVHGVLHLHGYDHENEGEAQEMEDLEVGILRQLGIDNPYK